MALPDLLRLAESALLGQAGPQLPADLLRVILEESSTRAGVLRRGDEVVARWPPTVSSRQEATDGWTELPLGCDEVAWRLRLLQAERIDEALLSAARLALNAWDLREELKRTRFDERFHLWELEAIRSIATNIGCIEDRSHLAEEIINHLVALLGVRSARLHLGPASSSAACVGSFGPAALSDDELAGAWQQGLYRDDVVALPLQSDSGPLGVLVAANKEARAGTEPFAANDVRLLELFALQVTVALEYARLTEESVERARLRQELAVAAAIQGHLHPAKFPEFAGFRIAARSSSSRHVAGDTYDVILVGHELVVTVTDVSGKGVGAGMIASGVHAGVHLLAEDGVPLEQLARRLNCYLVGATDSNRFATFALIRITQTGEVRAVNAGHCPLLIRRTDGSVEWVESSGLPLGIMVNATYRETSTTLGPGDLVVLYTDGLTEAEDPADEEFGIERVAEVVTALGAADAETVCDELVRRVHAHVCGQPLVDDVTLLVVERLRTS